MSYGVLWYVPARRRPGWSERKKHETCTSISCTALGYKEEKKPTANRRESALRARKIGFADPHSRKPALQSCSSLIGTVRANPVAAPAAPWKIISSLDYE